MDTLTAHLTCPRCGGVLLHDGFEATIEAPDCGRIDARCDHCLDVYRVTVTLTLIEAWPVDRCDPYARRDEATRVAVLTEASTL